MTMESESAAKGAAGADDRSRIAALAIRDRIKDFRRVRARDLIPNRQNWRKHPRSQVEALKGLLEEIGFADALLVRETESGTYEIIDGHLRASTVPDMLVPVLVLDVSADEAKKILLTLDPLVSMAEADSDRIRELLETVRTENQAVEELLRRTAGNQLWTLIHPLSEPPAQIDKAGELQRKWGTAVGQLWKIGEHRLLCGDSTNAADVQRLMARERAVLFASDPPYVVNYTGGSHPQSWANRGATNRNKDWSPHYFDAPQADVGDNEEAGLALYRGFIKTALAFAITPDAPWYCWHASRRHSMVEKVWAEFGAFVHQQIVWVKSRPVLTYSTYLWQHEPCLFGWVKGRRPKTLRKQFGHMTGEFPTTVWEVSSSEVETAAHPTSKPCRLFTLPMEIHTEPGDLVYEPFSGSGSQLVAAAQTGRRCFAIEKSPPFVAVALERMAALGLKPQLVEP